MGQPNRLAQRLENYRAKHNPAGLTGFPMFSIVLCVHVCCMVGIFYEFVAKHTNMTKLLMLSQYTKTNLEEQQLKKQKELT